jgi:hypothetical protein
MHTAGLPVRPSLCSSRPALLPTHCCLPRPPEVHSNVPMLGVMALQFVHKLDITLTKHLTITTFFSSGQIPGSITPSQCSVAEVRGWYFQKFGKRKAQCSQ